MINLLLIGLAVLITSLGHAQQSPSPSSSVPPLPPGPLIQPRAPGFAQWIIRAEAVKAAKVASPDQKAPSPASVESITKTGAIMLRQTVDNQKQVWSTWCVGSLQTTLYPDGKHWVMQGIDPDPRSPTANFVDYSKTDFPGFEWISKSNYVGQQEISGKKCLIFREISKGGPSDAQPLTSTAAIELETRYPVALIIGADSHTYEFKGPPQAVLTVPPLLQNLLESRQRVMSSATRRQPGM